jgi:ubiquinone/menaquinone biosynthesis C-methylase UbiE
MMKLKTFLQQFNEPVVLDVATGQGNFIKTVISFVPSYKSVIGIDERELSEDALSQWNSIERVSFLKMDAYHLEFDDNTFDLITLSNSFHHFNDHDTLFKEIHRVLKPNGVIILLDLIRDVYMKAQKSHLMLHDFSSAVDTLNGYVHDPSYKAVDLLKVLKQQKKFDILDAWNLSRNREDQAITEEQKKWLFGNIDRLLSEVKTNKKKFTKEASKIKSFIEKNGFETQTQICVIMRKTI